MAGVSGYPGGNGAQGQVIVEEYYGPTGSASVAIQSIRTITASSGSVSSSDGTILVNYAGTCNISLPAPVSGQVFNIKNINAGGTVVLTPASGNIENTSTLTINGLNNSAEIIGDGTNYWVV